MQGDYKPGCLDIQIPRYLSIRSSMLWGPVCRSLSFSASPAARASAACPTNWAGPQKQSNDQIWKMGRGTKRIPGRARKQSKRASEQSKRAAEKSKMTKNNPKTSKTIKNHTPGGAKRPRGAAFGGACVIFTCSGSLGIVFNHF